MSDKESVTAVVTRRIAPDRKPEYEDWVHRVGEVAGRFPGHQGVTYKVKGENGECHVVFRFDTVEHLRNWETSAERRKWVAKIEHLVEGEERIKRLTGLEFLFADQLHPKAHKMALVLIVVIFTLLMVLSPLVSFLFSAWPGLPGWLSQLFQISLLVLLMTYFIMPRVTRLLMRWLTR